MAKEREKNLNFSSWHRDSIQVLILLPMKFVAKPLPGSHVGIGFFRRNSSNEPHHNLYPPQHSSLPDPQTFAKVRFVIQGFEMDVVGFWLFVLFSFETDGLFIAETTWPFTGIDHPSPGQPRWTPLLLKWCPAAGTRGKFNFQLQVYKTAELLHN